MDINRYLIHFGISISVIFGGMCILHYLSERQLQLEEFYTFLIGIFLIVSAILWRKIKLKKNL